MAWRWACRSPRLARVIMWSATMASSLAFISVVRMRPWVKRAVAKLRIRALRCDFERPSLRPKFPCLMRFPLFFLGSSASHFRLCRGAQGFRAHAQIQAHLGDDLLDFVERLAAEVAVLEHFGFGLGDQ